MKVRSVESTTLSRAPAAKPVFMDQQGLGDELAFVCPRCRSPLVHQGDDLMICPEDASRFERINGIWRFLRPERAEYFQPFIDDYETIRQAEGRGSEDPAYYRALPEWDLTGLFVEDWRIRSRSYYALLDSVVKPLERKFARALSILDLGAGNGWLSNRLAERGHHLVAIDLLTNEFDGLGTYSVFDTRFSPVQAEFDSLPLPDASFDLVVFNGSIHYSTDYGSTIREALRVVRNDGQIVIMDTPVYHDASSGEQMIREREEQFQRRYGFPSNALPSEGYLTYDRLRELAVQLGVQWRVFHPWYGIRWALRPWKARMLRRREPARFLLIVGQRGGMETRPSSLRIGLRYASRVLLRARYQLFQRHRHRSHVLERVSGCPIVVLPDVFNPALFRSGEFLAETLSSELVPQGASVLDLGTGTGIGAVAAARWTSRVVAVDINTEAVRCARVNALMNNVEDRVDVREGDLFDPVSGEQFDVVLLNPPYFHGEPDDWYDLAWRSTDMFDRFAGELRDHLTSDGYALIVLSSDGESSSYLQSLRNGGYAIQIVARRDLLNEQMTIYRVRVE